MDYKMSDLVAKTNIPKSTILYYIKEGLLPEAKKIKQNVHKYNEEHIELIKYIKYMQESMGSSIEDIKLALKRKNDSFSGSYTMLAPLMNTLSGDSGLQNYSRDEFIEHFDISAELLDKLLDDEVVIPVNRNVFTKKDATIVTLVEYFLDVGVDYGILRKYVSHAKALADLEKEMQINLCDVKNEQNFTTLWKIMFETLFNAKEYIFNRQTYRVLVEALKEDMGKS